MGFAVYTCMLKSKVTPKQVSKNLLHFVVAQFITRSYGDESPDYTKIAKTFVKLA
jgi:hypothetical protein